MVPARTTPAERTVFAPHGRRRRDGWLRHRTDDAGVPGAPERAERDGTRADDPDTRSWSGAGGVDAAAQGAVRPGRQKTVAFGNAGLK